MSSCASTRLWATPTVMYLRPTFDLSLSYAVLGVFHRINRTLFACSDYTHLSIRQLCLLRNAALKIFINYNQSTWSTPLRRGEISLYRRWIIDRICTHLIYVSPAIVLMDFIVLSDNALLSQVLLINVNEFTSFNIEIIS